ncbi:MAG: hypothetical protein AB1781_07180 [Pseudomonadota bacterium]
MRELTRQPRSASLTQIAEELSRYLVGCRSYFCFCGAPSVALNSITRIPCS